MIHLSRLILRYTLFFCAFWAVQPVLAQEKPVEGKSVFDLLSNPMPQIKLLPEAEFIAQTDLHEETPFEDPLLAYKVRLPKGWVKTRTLGMENLKISQDVLGPVASYASPPRIEDARSEFKIQALALSYDIAASHWFLQYVLSNALNLEGIEEKGEKRVEALYVKIIDDITYIVNAVAIKNGRRIVLAEFFTPQGQWQNENVVLRQAAIGFDLVEKNDDYVQKIKTFKFLDISEYSYPERWEIRSPTIKSTDRMESQILNLNRDLKVLNGQIDVYLVSAAVIESLEEELLRFKDLLARKNLLLGPLQEVVRDFKFDESMQFGVVESYAANNSDLKLIEYELWLAVMSSGNYYYFLSMLTPKRTEDFITWSRNVGDFRIVVENIRPVKDKPALEEFRVREEEEKKEEAGSK